MIINETHKLPKLIGHALHVVDYSAYKIIKLIAEKKTEKKLIAEQSFTDFLVSPIPTSSELVLFHSLMAQIF